MRINAFIDHSDKILITFSDQKKAEFSLFWLRDHSRDEASLNPSTLQRDFETFSSPSSPSQKHLNIINDKKALAIHWKNEDLISEFDADFLYRVAFNPNNEAPYKLWDKGFENSLPEFDFNDISSSEADFLPVLNAMEKYGIVTFSNLPTDMLATKTLLEKVGYIRETVFGGLWDFSNNQAHSDSAYTSIGIGLHTDGTYTLDPPGLQLLHCLAFDGEGGFNQFADGFKIAQIIKDEDPDAYQTLTQVKVPAHYIEPGIQLRGQHAVVRENDRGQFEQICFNNFDRSPFKLSIDEEKAFYHAYGKFHRLINNPDLQIELQLRPGRAVWFDNWRTLHARTGFTGFRHLAGGYTNHEDFISKLLTLRSQTPWKE